jgi:para-aminobenzoate synthetase component 2
MTRVLVVDNYDSFTYNLVQYLAELGAECVVRKSDAVGEVAGFAGVLLSPGPGTPEQAVTCVRLVREVSVPVLGVCLGHQAIAVAFGASVTQAPELLHGITSPVVHTGLGVLSGLPNPFTATRYHSLAVVESTVPPSLEVTARTPSRTVMALRHRTRPIEGVQFHPESVLSEAGHLLLANWLARCGVPSALDRAPALAAEVAAVNRRPDRPGRVRTR